MRTQQQQHHGSKTLMSSFSTLWKKGVITSEQSQLEVKQQLFEIYLDFKIPFCPFSHSIESLFNENVGNRYFLILFIRVPGVKGLILPRAGWLKLISLISYLF